MIRPTSCALCASAFAIVLSSCAGASWDEANPSVTRELDDDFATAALAHSVPVDLAKAVAYTETRWHMVEGEEEDDGHPHAAGVFGLSGRNLEHGAELVGVSPEVASTDVTANIAAGTARLGVLARGTPAEGSTDLTKWAPVVEAYAQYDDDAEVRAAYARDVFEVLATGAEEIGEDGGLVASIDPHPEVANLYGGGAPRAGNTDYAGAVMRQSPNSSSRNGSSVNMIIIHTCEGAYATCWGYLRRPQSRASAHYVVKENGAEVTQLVRETSRAWHVAANYSCSRNSNVLCSKNGTSTNNFSVGIEHAGFASQGSWSSELIEASAKLACDISKRHNIPRDRNHIVGHGQLQPSNRYDPGRNWPWAHYISRVRAYCGDDGATPPNMPPSGDPPPPSLITPIIIDSNQSRNDPTEARIELTGSWSSMTSVSGYFGTGYWQANAASTAQPATFSFYIASPGQYTIDSWWTAASNRSTTTPFIALDASGAEVGRAMVNQRTNGSQWTTVGTWNFSAGWNSVAVSRWAGSGVVVADALRVR